MYDTTCDITLKSTGMGLRVSLQKALAVGVCRPSSPWSAERAPGLEGLGCLRRPEPRAGDLVVSGQLSVVGIGAGEFMVAGSVVPS